MTEVFFWVAAIPVVLFPVVYAMTTRWWRTDAGRQSMTLGLALLGLVALGLLRRWLGSDYPGQDVFRVVVYALVSVALWWRLVLLVRVQVHARWKKES